MLREVTVENGRIRGVASADPRVTAFKGIPFAAPPVGENRWRAPQPAENWEGTRLCQEFAPISVQDRPGVGNDLYCREWHVDPDIPMDEDCLYLNVWTGARSADEKLPVLVWYFGGGFQWGYTSEMEFDGERLARRGVVVVSVNYRLAALGFLAHPDITKESPETPGNFGLLDQKAGLDWVVRNIAAFGGDPDRITIAGQSAGGASTMEQLTCRENFDKIKFENYSLMENDKGELKQHNFEWLDISTLNNVDFRPPFIKDKLISGNYNFEHSVSQVISARKYFP